MDATHAVALPEPDAGGGALAARLLALTPGRLLTVVGLDAAAFPALLPDGIRPLLRLDLAGAEGADGALASILDDLATLALAAWPAWPASPMPPAEAPWDRVLHDALVMEPPRQPAIARLMPLPVAGLRGSAVERRMREALQREPDLAGLFENEVTLSLGPLGPAPRVDLLWRAGQIVVELDGAEHERDPNYGADRHRDYELMVAGYLVLRLTNAEIELDLQRALDKIRRVVNLRRH
jgi:Protein of unknown function (DUF559)